METSPLSPRRPHFDYEETPIQSNAVENPGGLTETALKAHDMSIPPWFRNARSESTTALAGRVTPTTLPFGFAMSTSHRDTENKPQNADHRRHAIVFSGTPPLINFEEPPITDSEYPPPLPPKDKERLGLSLPIQVPGPAHTPITTRRSPTPSEFSSSSEEEQPKSAMKVSGGPRRHLNVRWSADLVVIGYPGDEEGGFSDSQGTSSSTNPLPRTPIPSFSELLPHPQNSGPSVQPLGPPYVISTRPAPQLLFASTPSPPPVLQAPIPLPIDSFPVESNAPTPYHRIPLILCAPRIKTSPLPEIRIPSPIVTRVKHPTLEELMERNAPLDLTGEVEIPNSFKVAHGGFATVYTGVMYDRAVAVKVLKATKNPRRPSPWENALQRRLTREINVWSALAHPNIAEFLGYTDDFGDFTAMVSVWYHHGTATNYLSNEINISLQERLRLVQNVGEGIAYLHGLKIIHGDLKPTNVLIDDDGVARLCDFGLVRLDDWHGPAGMTTTSPYTGTERYKAPELFTSSENRHPVATFEGDVYALGCIALEFVTSKPPYYQYQNTFDIRRAIEDRDAPASRPRDGRTDFAFQVPFRDLLETCWAWYPENRPEIGEVVETLYLISRTRSYARN